MKRHELIFLLFSMLFTALIFWHEYKYDIPSVTYTTTEYVIEILIMAPVTTAIFYGIFYGIHQGLKRLYLDFTKR